MNIHLRPFQASDWKDLHAYLSDERVVRYEPYGVHNEEACKACARERAKDDAFLAIEEVKTGRIIGNLYRDRIGPEAFDTWTIGYVLNASYWGRGYAREAVEELLRILFEEHHAHRIVARCNTANVASWRMLERCGFRREGTYLQNAYVQTDRNGDPAWHDSHAYALLYREWKAR
jgi:RimJ/RimL family protein N-acetyltransferase